MQKNATESVTNENSDVIKRCGLNREALALGYIRHLSTNGGISKQQRYCDLTPVL